MFLYNIEDYKKKVKEFEENIEIFETQKIKEEERNNNLLEEKEVLKESLDKLLEEIERVQNLGFEGTQKKEQLLSDIKVNEERIQNNNTNFERFEIEEQELISKNQELESEKNQKISKKDSLYLNKDKFVKELEEKEQELEKFTKTLSDKEIEIEEKKQTVQKNIDEKYELIANINIEKTNIDNLNKKEVSIKNELSDTISDLDAVRTNKEEFSKGFYEIEKNKSNLEKEISSMREENEKSTSKKEEFDLKRNNLESDYRIKESKLRFLQETEKEKEGYQRSVKSLLEAIEQNGSLKHGVRGVLANLISVEKEYETAIEIALGAAIQNIVTDTEEEAKKLVKYLKDNKLGRASFLPITSVKGTKLGKFKDAGKNNISM